jgi:hypothetical protein
MMYKVFVKGNSELLSACVLLLLFGSFYQRRFASEVFRDIHYVYFWVHLLLTGVATLQTDKDAACDQTRAVG